MPFAQVHYPFENREWFDSHYPGDFIVEYHRPDPRLVLHPARAGHGAVRSPVVLDVREPRHSSSATTARRCRRALKNYPDPMMMVFDTYGSDAMRWYLLSSSILRGTDLAVTEDGIRDTVRQVMLPI
ncbi:MAG: hypothetical protein R2713_14615 [Ilumatobacteraceae bacterium]